MPLATHSHAILTAALSASVLARPDLFSKGASSPSDPGLSTGASTASGGSAPAGALWSEMPPDTSGNARAVAGVAAHPEPPYTSFRAADCFIVPPGARWSINGVSLFAYQPLATHEVAFARTTVRLWRGRPGAAGSRVIAGDVSVNRLVSSTGAGLFRIFSTAGLPNGAGADTSRPLWRLRCATPLVTLGPGQYWIDFGVEPSKVGDPAMIATVLSPARFDGIVDTARQFRPTLVGAAWAPVGDGRVAPLEFPQSVGLAFIIHGDSEAVCVAFQDLNSILDTFGMTPDGPRWNPVYDFNGDGTIDTADLSLLLAQYGGGCS